MKPITVLVTSAGSPGAPSIIEALKSVKERQVRVIGVDRDYLASGLYMTDEGYVLPPPSSSEYLNRLLDLSVSKGVDVILSLSTEELVPLAEEKMRFRSRGVEVLITDDVESVSIANNKYRSFKAFPETAPKYELVRSVKELAEASYRLGYPEEKVCVKPTVSHGSRGFRILCEEGGARMFWEEKPDSVITTLQHLKQILGEDFRRELLVVEYLPGQEYTIDSLAKDGETLAVVPRKRLRLVQGISKVGEVENCLEATEICREINRRLRLSYNVSVQLKRDKNGHLKLIEIQPRISGTVCLSIRVAGNLPYYAVKLALGEELPPIPSLHGKEGLTMLRRWCETYVPKESLKSCDATPNEVSSES